MPDSTPVTNETGQTQMFLQSHATGSVAAVWADPDQVDAYRAMGYRLQDPALVPDDFSDVIDDEPRGLIPIQSNFGGGLKFVQPYEVAWHEQNGWTAVHKVGQAGKGFAPKPAAPRRTAPPTTGSHRVVQPGELR